MCSSSWIAECSIVRYRQQRIADTTGHDPRTFAGLADLVCVVETLEAETDD